MFGYLRKSCCFFSSCFSNPENRVSFSVPEPGNATTALLNPHEQHYVIEDTTKIKGEFTLRFTKDKDNFTVGVLSFKVNERSAEFVIKFVDPSKDEEDRASMNKQLSQEIACLQALAKECKDLALLHIMPFYESHSAIPVIVMPYDAGFILTLHKVYTKKSNLTFTRRKKIITQVLSAIDYIAKCDFIHMDFKADNILVKLIGDCGIDVRVIDFGNAVECPGESVETKWYGTIRPPEMSEAQRYRSKFTARKAKTDLWCFAACVLRLEIFLRTNESFYLDIYSEGSIQKILGMVSKIQNKHIISDTGIKNFFCNALQQEPGDRNSSTFQMQF
jgi:serine/threonine protein kinase